MGPSHLLPLLTQGHNHVVTYPVDSQHEEEERLMGKTILMAVAAIAFAGTAYALESGATCDAEEEFEQIIVLQETTPTPDVSPAPGS